MVEVSLLVRLPVTVKLAPPKLPLVDVDVVLPKAVSRPEMVAVTHKLGARVVNLFFLVCTGRGEEMTDITPQQYEEVLTYLVDVQQQYPDMLVRARCAPHFKRIAYERDPNSPITKATGYMGGGCLAGTNYARVTPEGNLTPCPYMPVTAGNLRDVV